MTHARTGIALGSIGGDLKASQDIKHLKCAHEFEAVTFKDEQGRADRKLVEGDADVLVGGVDGIVGGIGPGRRKGCQAVELHVEHLQVQGCAEGVWNSSCNGRMGY